MMTQSYELPMRLTVKCEMDLHNSGLTCSERNLLKGCFQVSCRSLAVVLRYKWDIPLKSLQTTVRIIKRHNG